MTGVPIVWDLRRGGVWLDCATSRKIGPTKAMLGNARRRGLLAKVRARTAVRFGCVFCNAPVVVAGDCDNCNRSWLESNW